MMLRRYVLLDVVKFDMLLFGKTFEMIIPTMNEATRAGLEVKNTIQKKIQELEHRLCVTGLRMFQIPKPELTLCMDHAIHNKSSR